MNKTDMRSLRVSHSQVGQAHSHPYLALISKNPLELRKAKNFESKNTIAPKGS